MRKMEVANRYPDFHHVNTEKRMEDERKQKTGFQLTVGKIIHWTDPPKLHTL
jgi:hypothetical protein